MLLTSPDFSYRQIPDPPLTPLGMSQCEALRTHLQSFELAQKVELIVVSPMRRTLQTMELSLDWLIERGVPVLPHADWQERSDKPCDTGTAITTIAKEFPKYYFDLVAPEYPAKTGRWAFQEAAILQRGLECRQWLESRPEKVIAVVSHVGFLYIGVTHCDFANADYRVFDFVSGSDSYELKEWASTKETGGGMGLSPRGKWLS